jgi:triacylglycerol lipase
VPGLPGPVRPTIVLVHGLAILRRADAMLRDVQADLEGRGWAVARTLVQGDGTLDELAGRLGAQLDALDGPLALLCHSMGGLQARTLLLDDRRAARLAAIVTLGSPHKGVPLARLMGPFQRAYRDLTPSARRAWEARFGEAERLAAARHGVRCLSVVARVDGLPGHAQLAASGAMLAALEGPNDGLVSAASQRWGTTAFETDLDHLDCASLAPSPGRRARVLETWARMAELAAGGSSPPARPSPAALQP